MSRCFIKFPIRGFRRTQCVTSIGLFYKNRGVLWRVSDCEELVRSIKIELHSTKLTQKFFLVRACSGFFLLSIPLFIMIKYIYNQINWNMLT